MTTGRSLELFFVDGRPEGMLTAEVFNWTGHVLRIPRTRLAEGLKRSEATQTGVYVLLGNDDTGRLAYIGEAENMSERLKQHANSKDWWEQAVLVTTAGDALHKAHVKYLESRLVEIATNAGHTPLENGNIPPRSSLNEAARANMESFLDTLQMVLPAIRVDLFQTGRRSITTVEEKSLQSAVPVVFHFKMARHDVDASATLSAEEMIVQAGSKVRAEWVGDRKHNTHYWRLHDDLVAKGIIALKDGIGLLTENYAFSSPSAAAAVVAGRSANGRTSWKLPDGRTYADWEVDQLNKDTP